MKYSVFAILLTLTVAQSAHAATTALEAVETKRTSVQQRVDRNYYRSSSFKDVRAILDEKGFGQIGNENYGQNANTYGSGASIGGTPGGGTGATGAPLTPEQKAYQDAVTKLTNEFNARASNDQRAIDNYRAELEQSAGHQLTEVQTRLNQYLDAQKALQEEVRSSYQSQLAALGDSPLESAVAALKAAYASNYAYASSVYSSAISSLKTQYETRLGEYTSQLTTFTNNLNSQRQSDYYAAISALGTPH